MNPFLHVRSWLRSGPRGERLLLGTVGTLLLALVAWAAVPGNRGVTLEAAGAAPVDAQPQASVTTTRPTAATPARGSVTAPGGRVASSPVSGLRSTSGPAAVTGPVGTVSGPGSGAQSSACGPRTSTDQGVTATTITVGVVLADLGAANSLLSIPSGSDQKKAYEAVLKDLNGKGGIRCRKLVAKYYSPNPLSADAEHAACLQMAQDKVFAVLNNLVSNTEQTCIAKAKIPNFWYTPPHLGDVRKYGPYILSSNADFDKLIHQYVFASKSLGFFNGMKKLGLLVGTCFPDERPAIERELRAVGIDPSKASVFNYGCESFSNPSQEQSAALQLKRDGVTHVLNVAYAHDSNLTKAGDQQGFHPKYSHMDDASPAAIESATEKPGDSYDNTLLITTTQTGAAHTPRYRFNPATVACTKLLASAGLPSAYSSSLNALFGFACIHAAMLKAAADNAPSLTRSMLSTGLARAGSLDLPFPAAPFHLRDARRPTGGDVWRPGVWKTSCQCWQVTNVTFRSTY